MQKVREKRNPHLGLSGTALNQTLSPEPHRGEGGVVQQRGEHHTRHRDHGRQGGWRLCRPVSRGAQGSP